MKFVNPNSAQVDSAPALELDHLLEDARWEPLLDLMPDGIVLVDRTGFVRYLNSAAENISELLREEVVGRSLREFVRQAKLDCEAALEAFSSGSKINKLASNGVRRAYLLSTRCVRNWNAEVTCFLILMRDVEQIVRAGSDAIVDVFPNVGEATLDVTESADDSMILSDATSALVRRGLKALALGSRLVLLGESGVGKTEIGRVLHRLSGAPTRPFIHVNCGSIPESLFESEMFGYERGSFTGALAKGKKGLVEAADGGILFLDEVGEIPLTAQCKMLQFLEDSAILRVGATHVKRLKVQIIAATNRDLRDMVAAGTFRRDLYYRLNVVTLTLPPLRECTEVIDKLIDRFLARVNRRRPTALRMDAGSRLRLRSYAFPGNIRQLQNLIEHLAVVCDRVVKEEDLERALASGEVDRTIFRSFDSPVSGRISNEAPAEPLRETVRRVEARVIQETIKRAGSKRKAAELLGVDIATIVRKSRITKN